MQLRQTFEPTMKAKSRADGSKQRGSPPRDYPRSNRSILSVARIPFDFAGLLFLLYTSSDLTSPPHHSLSSILPTLFHSPVVRLPFTSSPSSPASTLNTHLTLTTSLAAPPSTNSLISSLSDPTQSDHLYLTSTRATLS